jgi:hypothetical protein
MTRQFINYNHETADQTLILTKLINLLSWHSWLANYSSDTADQRTLILTWPISKIKFWHGRSAKFLNLVFWSGRMKRQSKLKIGVLENPLVPMSYQLEIFLPSVQQWYTSFAKFQDPSLILAWFSRVKKLGIIGNRNKYVLLCSMLESLATFAVRYQLGRSKKQWSRFPAPWYRRQSSII